MKKGPSSESLAVVDRLFEDHWEEFQSLIAQYADGYPLEWLRPGLDMLIEDVREELKNESREQSRVGPHKYA